MIPALVLFVLCSPMSALKVNVYEPKGDKELATETKPANKEKGATCGIVMGAFGSSSYVGTGDKVVNHIRKYHLPKGWCPEQPELEGPVPFAYFTDLKDHVCPEGVQCFPETKMDAWDGGNKKMGGAVSHLGSWKYRYWHAQMLVHSPFDLTLYIDVDALPCSGEALAKVFSIFKNGNVTLGSILKPNNPHPSGLEACDADLEKCAEKADRNCGVIVADLRKTKKLFEDWSEGIKKIAGHADGDQAAYIKTLRQHLKDKDVDIKEHYFPYKQISRHQRDSCSSSPETLIHHSKHMTSLAAAGIIPHNSYYNPSR